MNQEGYTRWQAEIREELIARDRLDLVELTASHFAIYNANPDEPHPEAAATLVRELDDLDGLADFVHALQAASDSVDFALLRAAFENS